MSLKRYSAAASASSSWPGARQAAELIGVAEKKDVLAERGAEQRACQPRRIDEVDLVAAGGGDDRLLQALGRQRIIGVAREVAGQRLVRVDDDDGAFLAH